MQFVAFDGATSWHGVWWPVMGGIAQAQGLIAIRGITYFTNSLVIVGTQITIGKLIGIIQNGVDDDVKAKEGNNPERKDNSRGSHGHELDNGWK
jgi:hypothetical protein